MTYRTISDLKDELDKFHIYAQPSSYRPIKTKLDMERELNRRIKLAKRDGFIIS